jgi:hypothetical protein
VSWNRGGGYVGWAPLPPAAVVAPGGVVEVNVHTIQPRAYVFVEERHFLEPVRPTTVVVNNTTVINKTVNITNVKVVNNTVINEGPRTQVIEQASGRKVQAVPVHELRRKGEAAVVARQPAAPASAQASHALAHASPATASAAKRSEGQVQQTPTAAPVTHGQMARSPQRPLTVEAKAEPQPQRKPAVRAKHEQIMHEQAASQKTTRPEPKKAKKSPTSSEKGVMPSSEKKGAPTQTTE